MIFIFDKIKYFTDLIISKLIMNNIKYTFFLVSFFLIVGMLSAQRMSKEEYINRYKDIAIEQMEKYKIPASITLAQGMLESGNGNSRLSKKANNHFGIKCHKDWKGKKIYAKDDRKRECFRKYKNAERSFLDHSFFLTERDRYAELFKYKITDYKSWAKGLKKAGYATNKKYPKLLIKIIEENELYKYDDKNASSKYSSRKKGKDKIITPEIVYSKETDFEEIEIKGNNRKIYLNNKKKFIYARESDKIGSIAKEFEIYKWQVYKNNDLSKNDSLVAGQIVYLQKKRRKGAQKFHTFCENETMYSVSQLYGIQLKYLYKKNDMKEGELPKVGHKLLLR